MIEKLDTFNPKNWDEISSILKDIRREPPLLQQLSYTEFLKRIRKGIAFFTFDFGIDGVSIEISKYAQSLFDILSNEETAKIHFIAGDFHPQANNIIKPEWKRYKINGLNLKKDYAFNYYNIKTIIGEK